jgi:hypothetical protein
MSNAGGKVLIGNYAEERYVNETLGGPQLNYNEGVCARVSVWMGVCLSVCLAVCLYMYVYVCVCMCVCVYDVCVMCVCVCVCWIGEGSVANRRQDSASRYKHDHMVYPLLRGRARAHGTAANHPVRY